MGIILVFHFWTGPVEIAAVGVSIAIFNQVSKVAIFPLVNITTSFVAEEDTVKRITTESQKCDDIEKCPVKNNNETNKETTNEDSQLDSSESEKESEGKKLEQEDGIYPKTNNMFLISLMKLCRF